MRITSLAIANLRRRKSKAAFLAAGIAVGIATVVALAELSSAIRDEVGAQMDRYGANIVVAPHSDSLAVDYGGVAVSGVTFDVGKLSDADVAAISTIRYKNRLSAVAPKLLAASEAEGRRVVLAGLDFRSELRLKPWWKIEGAQPKATDEIVAGAEAAKALGIAEVHTGAVAAEGGHHAEGLTHISMARDRVTIAGKAHRVSGVLHPTGGPEDRMLLGNLAHVQTITNRPGEVSLVEVSALCKDCPVEDIVGQIQQALPAAKVSAVQQAVKARTQMVERLTRFSVMVGTVVLLVGGLMIFTTTMGSVVERTREIGVMRAIGFRRSHVLRGLLFEVAVISAAGGAIGWLAGIGASRLALPYFAETELARAIHPELLGWAVAGALAIGAVSSLYPAIRASRLDPSEAVRSM